MPQLLGLTASEVTKKQREFGSNYIETAVVRSAPKIFWSQFQNPLILILVASSVISGVLGELTDTLVILLMIIANSFLGFFQEYRSEKAVSALRKQVTLKAKVIRDGKESELDASLLVPEDLVTLFAGDVVPADIEITESNNFSLDEALITGESFPLEKTKGGFVYLGTNVLTGEAKGIVRKIGHATEIGKSAKHLRASEPPTAFQIDLDKFGRLLLKIIAFLVIFIFTVNAFIHGNILESVLFSLALAVGITPELLPVIITVNLASASRSLGKKGVIIKKLSAIEDLGNTDIICCDKTGTLTEGKISLAKYFNLKNEPDESLLLPSFLIPVKSPLEQAVETGRAPSLQINKNYRLISYTPFDFKHRRTEIFVETQNFASLHFIQGAPDSVIPLCQKNYSSEWVNQQIKYYNRRGFRLLAVASGPTEKEITLLGFLVFSDRPRSDVTETIKQLEKLGIKIKILTGDNELVAEHVAKLANIPNIKIAAKEELEALNEADFRKKASEFNVFARIDPEIKLKIIQSLKAEGHTVAFIGDGANDAPALKMADVGISVDSALPVAKEAADIILMRHGLDTLIEGVMAGRITFANSVKYILSTASANLGNMLSMAGASLFLPFLPLLPGQIILNNFLSDLPAFAIGSDSVDRENLRKPRHWDINGIAKFMFFFGLISSIFDILTFILLLRLYGNDVRLFRTGWFLESLISEIVVIFAIRTAKPFYKSRPSILLVTLSVIVALSSLGLIFSPIAHFFGFTALPAKLLIIIGIVVTLYFFTAELGKRVYFRKP